MDSGVGEFIEMDGIVATVVVNGAIFVTHAISRSEIFAGDVECGESVLT